jgi:hypothetical protein
MHSDPIHALKELKGRVHALRDKLTRAEAVREQLQEDLARKESEVKTLSLQQDTLQKVLELYRILMDKMVLDQVRVIESVVTEGLQTIFWDQDLSFKAELGVKYNKVSVDFYLCQGDPDKGGFKGDPLSSFGGGATSFISVVLRVLTLIRLKRHKILLLDETIGAGSDEYIEPIGNFLKKLSESTDLPILMVTHKPEYTEHSSAAYQGESKVVGGTRSFTSRKLRQT